MKTTEQTKEKVYDLEDIVYEIVEKIPYGSEYFILNLAEKVLGKYFISTGDDQYIEIKTKKTKT